jgi:egghead protein (zeste-white 4 protein)
MFHRPLFSWKGSYVVSRFKAERDVSYDHGLDGSVAEDCYFSMIAYQKGYTFDFIEGEMWEKSPFTIKDFIQQRKRWLQGIFLVVHSPLIPLQNKVFLAMSLYAWMAIPLSTSNILFAYFCPLPTNEHTIFNFLVAFVGAVNIYMYIFGVLKSFSLIRLGVKKFTLCIIGALLTIPFNIVIENVAVIWGLFGEKHKFYIVEKQITPSAHIV